jgi:hypothetical protein
MTDDTFPETVMVAIGDAGELAIGASLDEFEVQDGARIATYRLERVQVAKVPPPALVDEQ